MKKTLTFLALLVVSCFARAESAGIECRLEENSVVHIVFDAETGDALMVLMRRTGDGKVSATDTHYSFIFPDTDTTYEIRLRVNRFSGKILWEHGTAPFFANIRNTDNVHRSGFCIRGPNESILWCQLLRLQSIAPSAYPSLYPAE